MDSAHKLQILATLAFRTARRPQGHLHRGHHRGDPAGRGQRHASSATASSCSRSPRRRTAALEARVHPTMIPAGSPMAAVSGVFNAVFITGDNVGNLMFYGRGAGQLPTASAVWSDALEIARRVAHGIPALDVDLPSVGPASRCRCGPWTTIRSAYYLRVMAHGPAGRARPGGRHPRRQRHLPRLRAPEGPRARRGACPSS